MSANIDNIPAMNKLMKELNVNWSLEAYVEHDVIKKWQQGTNLSRPTNELFKKVVEEIGDNKNIVNSNDYLKMITKKGAPKVCFAELGTLLFLQLGSYTHAFQQWLILNLREWI